jgi:hypothetical protein
VCFSPLGVFIFSGEFLCQIFEHFFRHLLVLLRDFGGGRMPAYGKAAACADSTTQIHVDTHQCIRVGFEPTIPVYGLGLAVCVLACCVQNRG